MRGIKASTPAPWQAVRINTGATDGHPQTPGDTRKQSHAAALTDLLQLTRTHEGDAFVTHAGGRRPGQQHVDAAGLPAGFLDQFAGGGGFQRIVVVVVADQPGRHLDGPGLQRYAVLLDEQHLVGGRHRDHDHRHAVAAVAALAGFPFAAADQPQPLALMQDFGVFSHARMLTGPG